MRASLLPMAMMTAMMLTACGSGPTPADGNSATAAADGAQADTSTTTTSSTDAKPNIAAPARQPGQWTFTKVAANGDELSTDTLCVGPISEKAFSAFDQIGNGGDCTERSFTKTATGYTYKTVCGVEGMKPTTTTGTLTGDVATGYTLDEVLDLSPEGDKQKIVAKRTGKCSGLTDGQMKNSMGMTYSVTLQ